MPDYADRIKYINRENKTGAFTQGIAYLSGNYNLFGMILTLKSGSPGTIKLGTSYNDDDIYWQTDISYLTVGLPRFFEINKPFKPAEGTIYGKISSGVLDIDFVFIQRKAA